jgi:hypothetical protein
MRTYHVTTSLTQPSWRNAGRAWGIFCLAALFAVGAFFLVRRSLTDWHDVLERETASPLTLGLLYGVLAVIGVVKGEIIFRRKVLARALARARSAIGETGNLADLPLAPFCMLSLYRPWKVAHAISSWVIIPVMVGLAVFFRIGLPAMVGPEPGGMGALVRGPVYFGIGLALAFAALVYLVALIRFVGWWLNDGRDETIPLPEIAVRGPRSAVGGQESAEGAEQKPAPVSVPSATGGP